jgi:hypothetical protein
MISILISIILFILFSALQIADGVTTIKVLSLPYREETGAIAKWMQGKVGILPAMMILSIINAMMILSIINIVVMGGLLYGAYLYRQYWFAEPIIQVTVFLCCVQRAWTVRNNIKNM